MRSLEQVARERMEVAVSCPVVPHLCLTPSDPAISSNNYLFGEKPVTRMFPMLPTSLVSCSTRLANLRTNMSTDMTNTVLRSRVFATLRHQFNQAETVSKALLVFISHGGLTKLVYR